MSAKRLLPLALVLGCGLLPPPGVRTFHFMQIEQIIAGVDDRPRPGDPAPHAHHQPEYSSRKGRLIAWDAAGLNPVILDTMKTNVTFGIPEPRAACDLLVRREPQPADHAGLHPRQPDPGLLPAGGIDHVRGRLRDDLLARLVGGASYTETRQARPRNDLDGNFGPAFADPLPSGSGQALRINKAANALSTNNAADYGSPRARPRSPTTTGTRARS
jgi:hypothetical protein